MPSTASPYGLRPSYHPSGTIRQTAGTIATGYATSLLQFAPVALAAAGDIGIVIGTAGNRIVGVFMGVEYTDTNGRRVVANQWTASTTATEIVAYYTDDPAIVYEIQSDAAIVSADVGSQFDWTTATVGSTTTGLSSVALSASTLTSTGNAGLRVIGLGREADNAWADTFTNVMVQISEHQMIADRAAF